MRLHLQEMSLAVATDAHAVILVDQAGWHISDGLNIPANISIVLLPLSIGVQMLTGIGIQMLTTPQVEEVAACPGST